MATLTFIDNTTDLEALLAPYNNPCLQTIEQVANADLAIYNKYQELFISEISRYLSSVVGEVMSPDTIIRNIATMGFAGFHDPCRFDFQGLIDALGLQNEHYFTGDAIFEKHMQLYYTESAGLLHECVTEELYESFVMSI
ncbi:MAG: hypothetical protein ACRCZ9_06830 [Fusobacteriaceae bacterium]